MLNEGIVREAKTLLHHLQRSRGGWSRPGNTSGSLYAHTSFDHRFPALSEDDKLRILVEEIRFFYEATQRNTEQNAQIARLVALGDEIAAELGVADG